MPLDNTSKPLRVASYNIRKARGLDQKRDPGRILAVINGLEADIVALQEADKRLGRRPGAIDREMIARETDFVVAPIARNDVSLGWHGNAALLRKGVTATSISHFTLPGLEPRGAFRIDIDGAFPVSIIGAHLGLMRRDRQKQLKMISSSVTPDQNAVVLGDFNEWSPDRGLDPLYPRFEVHAPGRSFHARRPVAALDRIAVSKGLTVHGGGVGECKLARRASDHLPVWADIAPA